MSACLRRLSKTTKSRIYGWCACDEGTKQPRFQTHVDVLLRSSNYKICRSLTHAFFLLLHFKHLFDQKVGKGSQCLPASSCFQKDGTSNLMAGVPISSSKPMTSRNINLNSPAPPARLLNLPLARPNCLHPTHTPNTYVAKTG
jgi:hypothetical protein